MNTYSVKLLAMCALGAAVVVTTGCASSRSAPSTPAAPVASAQRTIQSGKVSAVETVAVVDQSAVTPSSGGSTVVTTASGGPTALTVQFADGSEGKYIIDHPSKLYPVGAPVQVITEGDRITIVSP